MRHLFLLAIRNILQASGDVSGWVGMQWLESQSGGSQVISAFSQSVNRLTDSAIFLRLRQGSYFLPGAGLWLDLLEA